MISIEFINQNNRFPLNLYFQVQFVKAHCTPNARNIIKYELKREQLLAREENDLLAKKKKYHSNPDKKRQAVKKRYYDKNESIKQYSKGKYLKNIQNYFSESIRKIRK